MTEIPPTSSGTSRRFGKASKITARYGIAAIILSAIYQYFSGRQDSGPNILGYTIIAVICIYTAVTIFERRKLYRLILDDNPDYARLEQRARKLMYVGCGLIAFGFLWEMATLALFKYVFGLGTFGAVATLGGTLMLILIGFALIIYAFVVRWRILRGAKLDEE